MGVNIARACFALLAAFEVLNYVSVLHFTIVFTWIGLILSSLAVWLILEATSKRTAVHPSLWFLALVQVGMDASGDIFKFYATIPHYDKYLHVLGGAITTIIVFVILTHKKKQLAFLDYWFSFASVMAFGIIYEFEEFWETALLHNNRWGGGADTMTDMTANAVGAGLVLAIAALVVKLKKKP